MQALALRQLSDADYKDITSLLETSYFQSPSFMVRLEALRLLALNHPAQSVNVLKAALNDSYELIRRYAAEYVFKNSSPELLPAWIEIYLHRAHEKRFRFKITRGLDAFDPDAIKAEMEKQANALPLFDRKHVDNILEQLPRNKQTMENDIATITNPNSKESHVLRDLRLFRNEPTKRILGTLLDVLKAESRPNTQRIIAAEVLGWYNMYYDKTSIISSLKEIKTNDEALMNEIQKTIARLEGKNR